MIEGESSLAEYCKLGLVLTVITVVSFLFYLGGDSTGLNSFLRWFMGVFFVVFSLFKFAGYNMFAEMFAGYDIVAKRFKLYGYLYPFIELALGIIYLADVFGTARDVVTLIIMAIGSIGVYHEVKRRSGIHCACLGNIIKLPLGTVSLVEDVSMGMMALVMLVLG